MKFADILAFASVGITSVVGSGVTSAVAPSASAPADCDSSYSGTFEITVAKVEAEVDAQKRDLNPIAKRNECSGDGILVVTLADGVLTDAQGRIGYIASNFQFQFDGPPQAGAIYTSGFSSCRNGSLAFGGSAVFYECASGEFYNLYDRSWAAQCSPVEIIIMECGGISPAAGDGQVVGTEIVTTTIVSLLSDGQPQVKTTTVALPLCQVSQISDGQVQVGSTPCASITSAFHPTRTAVPVSQYSDGQIQVTPPASVPIVASAPAIEETTVTAARGAVPAESGSTMALLSETIPLKASGSAPPSAASGTTSTASTGLETSSTNSATATGTSAPARNGASSVQTGSLAALLVGLAGAAAFL